MPSISLDARYHGAYAPGQGTPDDDVMGDLRQWDAPGCGAITSVLADMGAAIRCSSGPRMGACVPPAPRGPGHDRIGMGSRSHTAVPETFAWSMVGGRGPERLAGDAAWADFASYAVTASDGRSRRQLFSPPEAKHVRWCLGVLDKQTRRGAVELSPIFGDDLTGQAAAVVG
jgi:hypothetical protein